MSPANRRRLILLSRARTRALDTAHLAARLVEDLVDVKLDGDPVHCARGIGDVLTQLQGLLETEIGKVPTT